MLTPAGLDAYVARYKRERDPGDAVCVVEAFAVDGAGRARIAAAPGKTRLAAILRALAREPSFAIVDRLPDDAVPVERVFCDRAEIEIRAGELVIVALAPGVSAVELQALAEPTLKVSHEVVEMARGQ